MIFEEDTPLERSLWSAILTSAERTHLESLDRTAAGLAAKLKVDTTPAGNLAQTIDDRARALATLRGAVPL